MRGKPVEGNSLGIIFTLMVCALCVATAYRYMSMVIGVLLLLLLGVAWFMPSRSNLFGAMYFMPPLSMRLSKSERGFIFALIFFFISALLSYLLGSGWELKSIRNPSMPSFTDLDLPSKFILGALLFFLVMKINFRIYKKAFFYAIGLGGIINGCVAIYERYILGMGRVRGLSGIAEFADASAVLGIFACVLLIFAHSNKERIFYLIAVFMACFASILTGTRGAMLGIVLTFVFMGGLILRKKKALLKWFVIGALVGLSGFGVDYLTASGGVQDRIKVASEDIALYQEGKVGTSLGMRFEMWKEAIAMFQMAPIFGLSTAEIEKRMPEILEKSGSQLEKFDLPQNDARGNKHNQILNQAGKRGIVGVFAIFLIWFASIRLFLPLRDEGFVGSMLGLCMMFYFIFPNSFTGEPWESNVSFPMMTIFICVFYKLMQMKEMSA